MTKENEDGGKGKDDAMDCEFEEDFVMEASDDAVVYESKGKDDGRKEVDSSTSYLPSAFEATEKVDEEMQKGNGNDDKEEDEDRGQMDQCMVDISNIDRGKEDERRKGVGQGRKEGQGKKRKRMHLLVP